MRANPLFLLLVFALLLPAPSPLPIAAAHAQEAAPDEDDEPAGYSDDDDDAGNDDGATANGPQPSEQTDRSQHGRSSPFGIVRRGADSYDPEDDIGSSRLPHPLELANPGHDVVICEAGCDSPRGRIVYMKKKEPPQAR
jgi:hypothetical protein